LRHGDATPFEQELLDAASVERPPAELLASMQRALETSTIAGNAGVGAAATSSVGYVALAALAAGGAVVALLALREPARDLRTTPVSAPAQVVEAPAMPKFAVESNAPPRVERAAPVPARRAIAVPVPAARPTASVSELRDQIRLMDQARAALRSGATDNALSLLSRYTQRFPNGAFRQEATVLQLEALERAGERGKASSLARKFLNEHPESPHVERMGRAARDQ
jgi:TolA-binding protein